ncbi:MULTISPECIES: M56 family metallopeptidase [Actinoplanes]|uniref:M56 family metallopeptidase n=1 Tax=Actinoplanes TaxID=1865 RepID=UPI0005F2F7B5|nr:MULTISPECIES: M56 family metallopeptidase [Actinoplanes]GLY08358.1 integral membrane protein [Actinoplanes sp. NBRC 101535]
MTALALGALGLALSLIAPGILAHARWPDRSPVAGVLLWQALTLTAVLCALGVVLAAPEELSRAAGARHPETVVALGFSLAVAALIVIRLLISLVRVSYRARARRARHRMLVDLLDRAEQRRTFSGAEVRVLDGALPLAYCVPGRSPRVVLSGAVLQVLDPEQVDAVLAHERAHLRHRHELVMESFTAFYQAVPAPLRSRASLDAVHLLLEMVADDAARRRTGPEPLRAALSRLAHPAPLGEAAPADPAAETRRRLDRMAGPARSSRPLTVLATAAAIGLLVLPTVVLVVPWLARALDAWPFR